MKIDASNTPSPRSGRRPRSTQAGPRFTRPIPLLLYLEQAHPAELGELADMGVEHELAGETVAKLQDSTLPLAEDLGVRELGGFDLPASRFPRARRIVVEEVGVRVEAVHDHDHLVGLGTPLFGVYDE